MLCWCPPSTNVSLPTFPHRCWSWEHLLEGHHPQPPPVHLWTPNHDSIYLKVIIRPWTADRIERVPVELPAQFQCPESLLLLLIALYLSHPAPGQAPLACLCSLYTTRGRGNAWTDFLALVIFGYKESAHALLWNLLRMQSLPSRNISEGANGGWEDTQLALSGQELRQCARCPSLLRNMVFWGVPQWIRVGIGQWRTWEPGCSIALEMRDIARGEESGKILGKGEKRIIWYRLNLIYISVDEHT